MFDNHKLISHQVFIYWARLCRIDSFYLYIHVRYIYIYIVKTTAAAATTPVLEPIQPIRDISQCRTLESSYEDTCKNPSQGVGERQGSSPTKQPPRFQQEAERGWRRWRSNLPKSVWIKHGAPRSAVLRPGLCPVDLAKT